MAYKLRYSDYSTSEGPPDPGEWVGPPGPPGPTGPAGPIGPPGADGTGAVQSVAGKTGDVILIHTDITDWTTATSSFLTSAVASFNARVGAVTLTGPDVTTALGYSPYDTANPAGYQTA